jgi:Multiubiquitin
MDGEEVMDVDGARPNAPRIQIDRVHYEVSTREMTGAQLRRIPPPPQGPISADRDLFLVVPGGTDNKIADDEAVRLLNGMRFFTAPAQINPGRVDAIEERVHGVAPA